MAVFNHYIGKSFFGRYYRLAVIDLTGEALHFRINFERDEPVGIYSGRHFEAHGHILFFVGDRSYRAGSCGHDGFASYRVCCFNVYIGFFTVSGNYRRAGYNFRVVFFLKRLHYKAQLIGRKSSDFISYAANAVIADRRESFKPEGIFGVGIILHQTVPVNAHAFIARQIHLYYSCLDENLFGAHVELTYKTFDFFKINSGSRY